MLTDEEKLERRREWARAHYQKNKEQINKYRKELRDKNIEHFRAMQRESYENNKEQRLAYQKQYREKNIEKIKAQSARNYEKRKEAHNVTTRNNTLKRKYGLTIPQWEELFESQGRACAICGETDVGAENQKFHTDHCHSTNVVRGILCHSCNTGLGKFKDNVETLKAAIKYLENKKA